MTFSLTIPNNAFRPLAITSSSLAPAQGTGIAYRRGRRGVVRERSAGASGDCSAKTCNATPAPSKLDSAVPPCPAVAQGFVDYMRATRHVVREHVIDRTPVLGEREARAARRT
eukprot:5300853-Pleurochrysis_carterae.AAC.1